jgi:hypothetical protein
VYAVKKRFHQICDDIGLTESNDGRTAWVNVKKKMLSDILEHIRVGELK